MTDADHRWMERALAMAREAADHDEVPVGAVVVAPDGTPFGERNRTRELSDPTAHAEALAIRRAAAQQGDWRLEGHTLYVTLEPCTMCAGAIVLSRVGRVVFATHDPKAGMCGSLGNPQGTRRHQAGRDCRQSWEQPKNSRQGLSPADFSSADH